VREAADLAAEVRWIGGCLPLRDAQRARSRRGDEDRLPAGVHEPAGGDGEVGSALRRR